MKKLALFFLMGIVTMGSLFAQEKKHGKNQPYASYWFVEELLEWSPETDNDAKFNVSQVPLAPRFLNDSTLFDYEENRHPGIVALMAPHTTSKHPAQGFTSVKEYAFPFWQYIDHFVQWGGSAGEGIIVPPLATWTDAAHKNGVTSIGTVFFPPNVYGGKEKWVDEFLVQRGDGSFPVADKLIEVADTYKFDGWFINQETYDIKAESAALMLAFIEYYRKNSDLKLVWYDAMIEDSRVIWQDELNNHNQMFFQKDGRSMSDLFFINFWYHAVNLEDSKKLANELGRSEWDLYAGIDVQGKSYKTEVKWNILVDEHQPINTSIGLYFSNSTFNISETKEPEDVYAHEQKFWNGGTEIDSRFGKTKWKGFAPFFEPRSTINKLPFRTTFNYGLGRFYKENGKTVSQNEWHNLSTQDILPTWQWQVDSTKVKATISFEDSYEGGSSLAFTVTENAEVPLYKTNVALDKGLKIKVVSKMDVPTSMTLYGELSNGETLRFPLNKSESWKQTLIKLPRKSNVNLLKLGVDVSGDGKGHLGEIVLYRTKTKRLPTPQLEIEVFEDDEKAEAYVHFKNGSKAEYHSIYSIQPNGAKVWLGKTLSKDYYIAQVPVHNGQVTLQVTPIALDGTVGKSVIKKINVE